MTDAKPTRWFRLTPDRVVIGLLVVEGLLWLSNWLDWPTWHKGYAVLTVVAMVGATILLMLLWLVVALVLHWRFQFSIRSLLLLTVAVAIPCSWMTVEMKKAARQQETVDEIVKLKGVVAYDWQLYGGLEVLPNARPPAEWRRRLLGVDLVSSVVWISFGSDITDAGLAQLAGLTQVKGLNLFRTNITDAGLAQLVRLTQLQWLSLARTPVSDAGLAQLAGLNQLETLNLIQTKVTDEGLGQLVRLTQLHTLCLYDTRTTDAGRRKLQLALPNCTILH